jgi:SAM-dependent methyltransferase
MSSAIEELLRCPSCGGELHNEGDGLLCVGCGRPYARDEGTPVLLLAPPAEQAPPGLAGRALASIVARPAVYDRVQRLAGIEAIFRKVGPTLAATRGGLVLDVGAGTGIVEPRLPSSARYVWLDSDPQKLRGFRAKSQAPALLADATGIPLRDASVDWALSIFVSHHLDDAQLGQMLDELRRVSQRILFLDAVLSPRRTSRLLWRYDRGRHPRQTSELRRELASRFRLLDDEEFTVRHTYLLVTGE